MGIGLKLPRGERVSDGLMVSPENVPNGLACDSFVQDARNVLSLSMAKKCRLILLMRPILIVKEP